MTKPKKIDVRFFTVRSEAKDANDYVTYDKQNAFLIDDAVEPKESRRGGREDAKEPEDAHYDVFVV
jgi:hypothetical protein